MQQTEINQPQDTKPLSALDEVKAILEQVQTEKKELQDWTLRAEAVRAEQLLGGLADAGQTAVKEETPVEYKNRIMRGGK